MAPLFVAATASSTEWTERPMRNRGGAATRAREERLERGTRNHRDGSLGGRRDVRILIIDEQHQERDLLVRTRRQATLRRLQADVARDFTTTEEI